MKILIIEDDAGIAEVERDFLEINGFSVVIYCFRQENITYQAARVSTLSNL
jgi:response regulator of citrate/malate metabolism